MTIENAAAYAPAKPIFVSTLVENGIDEVNPKGRKSCWKQSPNCSGIDNCKSVKELSVQSSCATP